jgi:NAD(P)-dependent dehydrogenase (short-subunit alcohol dehydrogenase family)
VPARSFVVTGGAQGVGRAIAERLARDGQVVVLDRDADALSWTQGGAGLTGLAADATREADAERAVELAERHGPLAGWVNNAAVFRDAALHDTPADELLELIALNLGLAVTGCATAIRRFLAAGRGGAIVNVSSHQAQRPVPGALPYATAKAAIEGLTRALAVDYGPRGIRTNAVALGSIATARSASRPELEQAAASLHPLGRIGRADEVAAVVAHLLSDEAGFVNGAIVPVDGGRAALGQDPEARSVT